MENNIYDYDRAPPPPPPPDYPKYAYYDQYGNYIDIAPDGSRLYPMPVEKKIKKNTFAIINISVAIPMILFSLATLILFIVIISSIEGGALSDNASALILFIFFGVAFFVIFSIVYIVLILLLNLLQLVMMILSCAIQGIKKKILIASIPLSLISMLSSIGSIVLIFIVLSTI